MKIVVAPDSFKGNMRSARICDIIHKAILDEIPDAIVIEIPMADGGEGTVDALVSATGGRVESIMVTGPLGESVSASFGVLPDGTAVMEMASASGIELVPADRLDPMNATSFGTGEILRHLISTGHTSIIMGIGGSATVDGGTGMAQALGIRLLDIHGNEIPERGGAILSRIHGIDTSRQLPGLISATVRVACDVTNPLTGPNGAAAVFGPQKGATAEMIPRLDDGLKNLKQICGCEGAAGDGAAGGLGYGLRAFCGAKIIPGARLIAEAAGLEAALQGADLLITGEGQTDGQTTSGKLCSVLAEMARERGVKTMLLSGALQGDLADISNVFDFAFSISAGHTSLEACIRHAPEDLAFTVRNALKLLNLNLK
jgi:glycerate 2-kinase